MVKVYFGATTIDLGIERKESGVTTHRSHRTSLRAQVDLIATFCCLDRELIEVGRSGILGWIVRKYRVVSLV